MYSHKSLSIHLVGVGGIGVSGIAQVLLQLGHKVSGSDLNRSTNTQKLEELGATIYYSHESSNVKDCDLLVYSSAISMDNPEMKKAKEDGIPMLRRAEVLADLMKLKQGIAVAGTHGKTTTSSLMTTIFREGGYEPAYAVGGVMSNLNHHAFFDKGDYLIAEVDESDGSFLYFSPIYSFINNVDNDHLSHYGDVNNLKKAFKSFANKVPFFGCTFLNIEDPYLKELSHQLKKPCMTVGLSDEADYYADNIEYSVLGSRFEVFFSGESLGVCEIVLPGEHNVLNALGALSVAHHLGVSFSKIQKGLKSFSGVARRFQKLHETENALIVDDYAHHPTELLKTIHAAKKWMPEKKLCVFFEPHRYSRTKECWSQFLHCFNEADELYLLPIYAASEKPILGIDEENLAKDIQSLHPGLKIHVLKADGFENALKEKEEEKENKLILTLGAGAIGRRVREYVQS